VPLTLFDDSASFVRPPTFALFGTPPTDPSRNVYLNTSEPFCAIAVGVQGSGKSHTVSSIVEACMLNAPPVTHLGRPLSTLALHYDRDPNNFCELLTLTTQNPNSSMKCVVPEMVVLLSSSIFELKRKHYEKFPNCRVYPLLFNFDELTASMLKEIMGVGASGDQLYVSVIMDVLRRWQRSGHAPSFAEFLAALQDEEFSRQQIGPMNQRLALLRSLVREADENKKVASASVDVLSLFHPGCFVVVDYSNPLVTQNEANSVFNVLLQMFISVKLDCGRLVVLDEAHKYLGKDHGELGSTMLECIRQMRHHGLRVVIATQDPSSLERSMLELSTLVVLHFFFSPSWFSFLSDRLPLPPHACQLIQSFAHSPGHALVFCPRAKVSSTECNISNSLLYLHIRQRLTADAGQSRLHGV